MSGRGNSGVRGLLGKLGMLGNTGGRLPSRLGESSSTPPEVLPSPSTYAADRQPTWTPVSQAAGDASTAPHTALLASSLHAAESHLLHQGEEQGVLFHPEGTAVLYRQGTAHSVPLSVPERQAMRDMIFTHNHPDGGALSAPDLHFAASVELREMRAIGSNGYLYTLKAPPGQHFTPALADALFDAWHATQEKVSSRYVRYIRTGKMSRDDAFNERGHEINLRVAKQFGLQYSRSDFATGDPRN